MRYIKPLQDALERNDIIAAKAAIITYVNNDAMQENLIALKIADEIDGEFRAKGEKFYETDDGRLKYSSQSISSSSLWNKVKAALSLNFSREKVELATQITLELRENGVAGFTPKNSVSTFECSRTKPEKMQLQRVEQPMKRNDDSQLFNKPLSEALCKKDIIKARAAIITYVDRDLALQHPIALEVADMVEKKFSQCGEFLYEPDNGRLPQPSSCEWDMVLWNRTKAAMSLNFSREKIEFATKISSFLKSSNTQSQRYCSSTDSDHDLVDATPSLRDCNHPASSGNQRHASSHTSQPNRTRITVERRSSSQQTAVVGAVVVGAVIGGVVGAVVGATVVGVVVGSAVVGGITYYNKK